MGHLDAWVMGILPKLEVSDRVIKVAIKSGIDSGNIEGSVVREWWNWQTRMP